MEAGDLAAALLGLSEVITPETARQYAKWRAASLAARGKDVRKPQVQGVPSALPPVKPRASFDKLSTPERT